MLESFETPEEAYLLELVDESGTSSRIADWVKPTQFATPQELASGEFEQGLNLYEAGDLAGAERKFQKAFSLEPGYKHLFISTILSSHENDWEAHIIPLRLLFKIDPNYEYARLNLAIAYLNWGIQKTIAAELVEAILLFQRSLTLESNSHITERARKNLAGAYTLLGIQKHQKGDFENERGLMKMALAIYPSNSNRQNVGISSVHLARQKLDQGNYDLAVSAFEEAQESGLILPEPLNDYGVALAHLNRLAEAKRSFERALELAPGNIVIRANLLTLSNTTHRKEFRKSPFSPETLRLQNFPSSILRPQEYQLEAA